MSTSRYIKKRLEPTAPMDVAFIVPAADVGLNTIDHTHGVVDSYSPESAQDIPMGESAAYWRKLILWFTPLLLAFGWVAFFKAARRLKEARDRTFDLWLNAGVSFALAAGATVIIAFMLAGLAPLVPYILMGVLGLNILQGLYYTTKNLYLAYRNRWLRSHYLKEAGKSFLGIVINTLALALNIAVFQTATLITDGLREFAPDLFSLFMHFQELMDLVNGPVMSAMTTIKGLGIGWLSAFALGLIVTACRINRQSYRMIAGTDADESIYEREALKDMTRIVEIICDQRSSFFKRAFFLLTAPLTLPLYAITGFIYGVLVRPVAALVVGIPELLLRGLWWGVKRLCCIPNSQASHDIHPDQYERQVREQRQPQPQPQPQHQVQQLLMYQQVQEESQRGVGYQPYQQGQHQVESSRYSNRQQPPPPSYSSQEGSSYQGYHHAGYPLMPPSFTPREGYYCYPSSSTQFQQPSQQSSSNRGQQQRPDATYNPQRW